MGVKDLWSVLTPHAERKPIYELRKKTVAIDLAGWVCESLNVVDYFVHPRHHLKNLFFRTCYLIWEEITPIFVLEGEAPKLKSQVIAKRNELQFRGVKPKERGPSQTSSQAPAATQQTKEKGRTRFNHILKQCETLLQSMGVQCVQAPGEAEAYCAFLNKHGLVDGVISQDSDCFAYGAVCVYRNFSVSTQGAQASSGGAVDIYDIRNIFPRIDFGQNKIITMALLCGCDYCPDGIGGVGRDGVLKFFNSYSDAEVLDRIKTWRREDTKYTALEIRVDDKSICTNCGHLGRTQSHSKNGCGICRTTSGCNESLWKEQRLALKAELSIRKKALADPTFPSEEIIQEFLNEPAKKPNLNFSWNQPNVVKFIKKTGHLLQWPEIYCFQKFFPILTRWHIKNAEFLRASSIVTYVEPKEIIKKRTLKGIPSLELIWKDSQGLFNGLIPDDQLLDFERETPKGLDVLWTTLEPLSMLKEAYPEMVESFIKSKEKPKKVKISNKIKKTSKIKDKPIDSLENLNEIVAVTNEIAKTLKPKRMKKISQKPKKAGELITKFFKQNLEKSPVKEQRLIQTLQSSTPVIKSISVDLESEDDEIFNMSDIVNGICKNPITETIMKYSGRILRYEPLRNDQSLDDLDLMTHKRALSLSFKQDNQIASKRVTLDDSFDALVINTDKERVKKLLEKAKGQENNSMQTHIDRFKIQNYLTKQSTKTTCRALSDNENISYFFDQSDCQLEDGFEIVMNMSLSKTTTRCSANVDYVEISDSSSSS